MIELVIPELTETEKKLKVLSKREFNYYFKEGTETTINIDVLLLEFPMWFQNDYRKYIGQVGYIVECYSDLHAAFKGNMYSCKIKFGDDVIDLPACYLNGGIQY